VEDRGYSFSTKQSTLSGRNSKFKETINNLARFTRHSSAKILSILATVSVLFVGLTLVQQQQRIVGKAGILGSCPAIQKEEFGKKPDLSQGRTEIENLNSRTRELSEVITEFKKANFNEKKEISPKLLALSTLRKSGLVQAMRKDPEIALNSIFLGQEEIQPLLPNCFEEERILEGDLEVSIVDFFEDDLSDTAYILNTQDGKKIQLHPAGSIHVGLESGTKVKVKGILIDDEMVFDASRPISQGRDYRGGIDVVSQPGNPPVIGEQKTVFLLVNFRNTPQPSLTTSQVTDFLTNTLNPYYIENSFNEISVTGDVFGWYTLPIDQTCNYTSVRNQAISISDNDVYFPNYSRLIIITPFGPSCGWAGISSVGKVTVYTADGYLSMSWAGIHSYYGTNLLVVGHELGHGFGNHHASFLDCGDVTIADLGCTVSEYGDSYDILGNMYAFQYNVPHKEYVGWFEPTNFITVTQNGTYVLEPIERQTTNLKALKIQRKTSDYLFIEYRQPIGYDTLTYPSSNIYDGALLHTLYSANKTLLLDPTPLDSKSNIALTVGSSFTDPATATRISVTGKTSNALTLNVALGKTEFIPPTITINSPTTGTTISGLVPVSAVAFSESGIQSVEFYLDTIEKSGLISTDLEAPYGFTWDTTHVTDGYHFLYAIAYDKSGEPWGVPGDSARTNIYIIISNGVSPTPTTPPALTPTPSPTRAPAPTPTLDTTPPSVSITYPINGGIVNRNSTVNITASATDNIGVLKVEFSINGILWCTDVTTPYNCSWRVPAKRNASYTIRAKAYDLTENTAIQNITVTAR